MSWKIKFGFRKIQFVIIFLVGSIKSAFGIKIEFFRKIMVSVIKTDSKCTSKPLFDNKVTDQICIWKRWVSAVSGVIFGASTPP